MNVSAATRVFGSELLVALIRYYQHHPGTSQADAALALGLPHQSISTNTRMLRDAGVVHENQAPGHARKRLYSVDEDRVRELAAALVSYSLG